MGPDSGGPHGEEQDDRELGGLCSTVIPATAEVGQGSSEIVYAMKAQLDAMQARMDAWDAAHTRAPALSPEDRFQATVPDIDLDAQAQAEKERATGDDAQEPIIVPPIAKENGAFLATAACATTLPKADDAGSDVKGEHVTGDEAHDEQRSTAVI